MMDRYEYSTPTMGTFLKLVVYADSQSVAQRWIDSCLNEIDRLIPILNNYSAQSEISSLNARNRLEAGTPVAVSKDLYQILEQSRRWHGLSNGVFDVTCGSLFELWKQVRKSGQLPSDQDRTSALELSGWQHVEYSRDRLPASDRIQYRVTVHKLGLILDFSGIATGYIIDSAVDRLTQAGCRSFLIDIGGDIRMGDAPPGKQGWNVQIAGLEKNSPPILQISLNNCSLTTSGDRNQFVLVDGVSYSHLLDPRTGKPLTHHQSCTAISLRAIDADAAATSLSILGRRRAAQVFDSLPIDQAILLSVDPSTDTPPTTDPFFIHLSADNR